MAIALAAVEERLAVDALFPGVVKLSRRALARGPVALDVAQMRGGSGGALSGELDDARFDDDPARARGGMDVAAGEHPSDPAAAPDPASGKAAPGKVGSAACRERVWPDV